MSRPGSHIKIYTRRDCCLCEDMKALADMVAREIGAEVEEVNVDQVPELKEKYGHQVPVLFINGRKAFKYRTTARELRKKLRI